MKELENIIAFLESQDKLNIGIEIPVKTEKHLDSMVMHKGHSLFRLDLDTGKIDVIPKGSLPRTYTIVDEKVGVIGNKLLLDRKFIYICALNIDNAEKKFTKIIKSVIKHL